MGIEICKYCALQMDSFITALFYLFCPGVSSLQGPRGMVSHRLGCYGMRMVCKVFLTVRCSFASNSWGQLSNGKDVVVLRLPAKWITLFTSPCKLLYELAPLNYWDAALP